MCRTERLRRTIKPNPSLSFFSRFFSFRLPARFFWPCAGAGLAPHTKLYSSLVISLLGPAYASLTPISFWSCWTTPLRTMGRLRVVNLLFSISNWKYHPMQINAASPLNAGSLTFGPSLIVLQLESHSFPVLTSALCCLLQALTGMVIRLPVNICCDTRMWGHT